MLNRLALRGYLEVLVEQVGFGQKILQQSVLKMFQLNRFVLRGFSSTGLF